ncbi:MAG: hypothetical protein M3285_10280 [Actinomycetota bacterium]|nr:hypothetical protein [Actinomycetota bacterium]
MSGAADQVRATDRYLEVHDLHTAHSIEVDAAPTETYRACRELDLGRSVPVAALFALRGLPHFLTGKARLSRSLTLETFLQAGFTIFEEHPPRELVMGTVGKFWRPDGSLVSLGPEEFFRFDKPGYAKAVLAFTVEEQGDGSLVTTETRVACTDESARRKFSLYWRVIGPFSGFIRRLMLEEVKRTAERGIPAIRA